MQVFSDLNEVVALVRSGKVGILPTDTVYGIVASAHDEAAIQRVYELKQRSGKPGTIIAASIEQLVELGFKKRYLTVVEQFWPGAVSVIIPCFDLVYLHQGTGSVPVRIAGDKKIQNFLVQTGPLQTSSANLTGQPEATTVQAAQEYFGDRVDFYVEGGDLSDRMPSTVIRIVDDAIEVLRQGAVALTEHGTIQNKNRD